LTVLWRS